MSSSVASAFGIQVTQSYFSICVLINIDPCLDFLTWDYNNLFSVPLSLENITEYLLIKYSLQQNFYH